VKYVSFFKNYVKLYLLKNETFVIIDTYCINSILNLKNLMKTNRFFIAFVSAFLLTLSSCSVIGDIFKTGVGVGIFLVIFVVGIIIYFVSRIGGK
jgi:hypothetical protein